FCNKHKLEPTNMIAVAKGKSDHHNNWKCRYPNITNEEWRNLRRSKRKRDWIMYTITFPNGREIEIDNLKKFCRENKLLQPGMRAVMLGISSHHRKYHCRLSSLTMEEWKELYISKRGKKMGSWMCKNWICIDPNGKKYKVSNLNAFCKNNNLISNIMYGVAKGK